VENQSNTESKGITKSLNEIIKKSNRLQSYSLKNNDYVLEMSSSKFVVSKSQVNAFINKNHQLQNQIESSNKNEPQRRKSLRKNYLNTKKKILKNIKNISTEENIKSKANLFLRELSDEQALHVVHDITSLPSTVLQIDGFNSFTSCQMLVHEKGNSYSYSYTTERAYKRINVDQFNKTFQTIKKSKSYYFNSTQFSEGHIELIGNFPAIAISSKRFSWILLMGRNDFFPPEQSEIDFFITKLQEVSPIIESILHKCKHDDNVSSTIDIFENIGLPILIKDCNENIVFKNHLYDKISSGDHEKECLEIPFDESNSLHIFLKNNEIQSTDIYHHYKVNLLGELLNTLSHELSNPLFGLKLSAQILGSYPNLDTDSKEFLSDISNRSERCQTIIKNFSQLYDSQEEFRDANLIDLINETITLTKSETRGIKKTVIHDLDTENINIHTNPTWLSQVVFNLIINAAQAIESDRRDGEIIINCSHEDSRYRIDIIDNGQGIPQNLSKSVFQAFFTTKKSGTGLGLSICLNLLEKLRGELKFTNREDVSGSIFSIIIFNKLI
jgi:nitrogen-specific signal transduction histidine kinase